MYSNIRNMCGIVSQFYVGGKENLKELKFVQVLQAKSSFSAVKLFLEPAPSGHLRNCSFLLFFCFSALDVAVWLRLEKRCVLK